MALWALVADACDPAPEAVGGTTPDVAPGVFLAPSGLLVLIVPKSRGRASSDFLCAQRHCIGHGVNHLPRGLRRRSPSPGCPNATVGRPEWRLPAANSRETYGLRGQSVLSASARHHRRRPLPCRPPARENHELRCSQSRMARTAPSAIIVSFRPLVGRHAQRLPEVVLHADTPHLLTFAGAVGPRAVPATAHAAAQRRAGGMRTSLPA